MGISPPFSRPLAVEDASRRAVLPSPRTFNVVVELCRLGYGQQASMLNRTLFEDMVFAHWAARLPYRSNKLMRWHEDFVESQRIRYYVRHNLPHEMTPPEWWGKRKKRMARLFGRGTWTGRSVPTMVKAVETMRAHGRQGFNILMHHSSRSLSDGSTLTNEGNTGFDVGPSRSV